jgi:hypothetical protein
MKVKTKLYVYFEFYLYTTQTHRAHKAQRDQKDLILRQNKIVV